MEPSRPASPGARSLLATAAALLLGVLVLGLLSGAGRPLHRLDVQVLRVAGSLPGRRHGEDLAHLMAPQVMSGLLVLAAALVTIVTRKARPLLLAAAALVLSSGAVVALKAAFSRPGPAGEGGIFGGAYPSGHTTTALVSVTMVLLLVRLAAPYAAALGVAAGSLVGGGMVVIASHWVTDVVGGLLLGLAVCAAVVAGDRAVARVRAAGVPVPTGG